MRLDGVYIKNFKLLEDIEFLVASDKARPLTVIRAENGSGKTSILQALRWAMYGDEGISQGMRLTSTAIPAGTPTIVQVRLDFTEEDHLYGEEVRYRLIRTCDEVPGIGDTFSRSSKSMRLLRLTDRGEEEVEEGKEAEIRAMLPVHLADIFFTNGDDVQRFIAGGRQAEKVRQEAVHKAIRQLLGLEQVENAEALLVAVQRDFNREIARQGGDDLKLAQEEVDRIADSISQEEINKGAINDRISNVREQIHSDQRELEGIKGIGDLDAIQARIRDLERDLEHQEREEAIIRREIKEVLSSESLSQAQLADKLSGGVEKLNDLADRHAIPGYSVEVLVDRLELGECICGESLEFGQPRHAHVSELIEEQRQISPIIHKFTALWHQSRARQAALESDENEGRSPKRRLESLRERFAQCKDIQRHKEADLRLEKDKRAQINQDRVQTLSARIASNEIKRDEFQKQLGVSEARLSSLSEENRVAQSRLESSQNAADLQRSLERRSKVVGDLVALARGTLGRLQDDYVRRVSDRMNDIFLDIVGASPESDSNVFVGVRIDEKNHDIVIDSLEGRTLDADTELNGASQRALTLSFIWALMEVAERVAPRIIDTPLGMTSGAVKQRMVEKLSVPIEDGETPYQTILFMTRSEIRDIEPLITQRAGAVSTLTCSKDYPRDLVHDWGVSAPVVRVCSCSHMQYCSLCERRRDSSLGVLTMRRED